MASKISAVKLKTKAFLADRKNANNMIDIMTVFESEEDDVLLACMRSLHRIFSRLLAEREMYFEKPPVEEPDIKDLDAGGQFKMWLRDRYNNFRERLLELITHPNSKIQELTLCTLMKLVEAEAQSPLRKISKKHLTFPATFFQEVVLRLLSADVPLSELVQRFQEYLEFDDVRYFTMKGLLSQLKGRKEDSLSETYLENAYNLMMQLSLPKQTEDALSKFLSRPPESEGSLKMGSLKEHKKLFTTLWLEYISLKLPARLYKKVLVCLSDKVMPHMSNPLLLADFLTNSYNMGGAISLLALNGLFVLVNAFNLDYPDFFKKLYALFEPSVFHVKYRARFFFLADLFLTSTHLPGYLVAAFIKKLARLSLSAPPHGLTVILPFIYNLLHRHPNCKVLLHKPDGPTDESSDPFIMEEPDPMKCRALESSLWEVKSLQEHYYHAVAIDARKINNPLNAAEIDLSDLLECSHDDLFQKEVKKKMKTVPVTFECPQGIFAAKNDTFKDLWVLE